MDLEKFLQLFPNLEEIASVHYEFSFYNTFSMKDLLKKCRRIILKNVDVAEPAYITSAIAEMMGCCRTIIPCFTFTADRTYEDQLFEALDRFAWPLWDGAEQQFVDTDAICSRVTATVSGRIWIMLWCLSCWS